MQSHYRQHIFFCTNQRDSGKRCCAGGGGNEMCRYTKSLIKDYGLAGAGGVRVSSAGCMGRCLEGPACVIYPDGVWYTYQSQDDVKRIVDEHIVNGRLVDDLLLV